MNERHEEMINRVRGLAAQINEVASDIDKLGEELRNSNSVEPAELVEVYFYLKEQYDAADKSLKRVYHVNDMLNKHLIPERLMGAGLDGIRVPSIARSVSIITKTSASMTDKEKGFEWLRSIGQGDLIQETVNAGTLAAFCRNLVLEQGIDPPADIVKVSTYNTTGLTKYRPKAGEV